MPTPSPRNLDPKFSEESAMPDEDTPQEDTKDVTPDVAEEETDDTPMVVYHQPVLKPGGVMETVKHGPMPVSEWAAYEKEHNL